MAERDESGKFKKGHKGIGGRPKKVRRIDTILSKIGDETVPYCETEDGEPVIMTRLEAVLRSTYKLAEDGREWAMKFIAERTEGKPRELPETDPEDFEPITLIDFSQGKDVQ
jgi:hypothetical protein